MSNLSDSNGSIFQELLLMLAVAGSACLLLGKVVLNPDEVLYSPYSDILAQHYPYRHLMVHSLREAHRLPTWNPTAFCGMPLVGDPQAGLFYPPNWLHALVPADRCGSLFGWLIIAHLIVGGWGVLWWLRRHDFDWAPRLAAAIAFIFCGKWILHVLVPGHIIFLPLMFLPWQFGLIDRIWAGPRLRLAASLAAATALTILGSHTQQLFYSQLLLLGYVGVSWKLFSGREHWGQSLLYLAGAGAMSLALSAQHLLPIFGLLDQVVRGDGVPYSMAARRSQQWSDYITFLLPSRAANGHWENTSYVGVAAAVLAVFGLLDRKRMGFRMLFLGTIVFALFYGVGEFGWLHRFLYDYAPGFHLFRIPPRIFLILGLPVAYLVAAGVDRLSSELPSRLSRVIAVVAAAAGLLVFFNEISWDSSFAAWALFAVGMAAMVPSPKRRSVFVGTFLILVLLIDQARFVAPLVGTRTLDQALGRNPLVEMLRAPLGRQRYVALNYAKPGMHSALPVAYATPHRLESVRGFNPLIPASTFRYVRTGVGGEEYQGFFGTGIREFEIASREHLDLLNVRWVITDRPLEVPELQLRETFDDLRVYHFSTPEDLNVIPKTYVYENLRVFPRAALVRRATAVDSTEEAIEKIGTFDPRQEVLVESADAAGEHPGQFVALEEIDHRGDEIFLTVDAGEGGYLVLSEMWYPGWRATVDGRSHRPLRVNGVFQGIRLGPGRHEVHLFYRPWSYVVGWRLSLAAWAATVAAMFVPFGRLQFWKGRLKQ